MSASIPPTPVEIAEDEASGVIKELYDDLKSVLGIGIIPLVFRLMASLPGSLPWCWNTIRPLYLSGDIPRAGKTLIDQVPPPDAPPLSQHVFDALGISHDAVEKIRLTLAHFNYSNPMNLISLSTLLKAIDSERQATKANAAATASGKAETHNPLHNQPLLPMLDIDEMDDTTIALIHELQKIGIPSQKQPDKGKVPRTTQGMASVWRILARWPAYLALALSVLKPLEANGWFATAQGVVRKNVDLQLQELLNKIAIPLDIPRPEGASLEGMKAIIQRFTGFGLIRMLPLAKALQHTLPEA